MSGTIHLWVDTLLLAGNSTMFAAILIVLLQNRRRNEAAHVESAAKWERDVAEWRAMVEEEARR
jgi:hypothetical protein